jgi:hypothetical protein
MKVTHLLFACAVVLVAVAVAGAGGLTLETAHGTVTAADKASLTFQARGSSGAFGKKLTLKLTGTSKLMAVSLEKRGGKLVPVQRDVQATDLEAGQPIAIIYTTGAEPVLLSGVLQRGTTAKK